MCIAGEEDWFVGLVLDPKHCRSEPAQLEKTSQYTGIMHRRSGAW